MPADLTAYMRLLGWLDDPASRLLIPLRPMQRNELPKQLEGEERERIQAALYIADDLLRSNMRDLRWNASFLFDPIIAGGAGGELERLCMRDARTQRIWGVYHSGVERYWGYEHLLQMSAEEGAPSSAGPAKKMVTVIVHGTNAQNNDWWREVPGSRNFWAYIDSLTGDCVRQGHEFKWSGGIVDAARRQGARLFINWWLQEGEQRLRVVAHSHGANVVWYATTLEPKLEIETMIVLGAPICVDYTLRLRQIGRLENVYSEHDTTQKAGAHLVGVRGEGRSLPDSSRVTNHHAPYWDPKAWGVRQVWHTDLHEEGVWTGNKIDKLLP